MSKQTADIVQNDDGDLIVLLRGHRALLSEGGRPQAMARLTPVDYDDGFHFLLESVPSDRALLMIKHGCTHAELELDRMIWAAAYERRFSDCHSSYLDGVQKALSASRFADDAVLCRWQSKGE